MKRNVLITGGARGIGAALAQGFVAQGCQVWTPTRQELDLSSPESLENFLAREAVLPVDILINNAGINLLEPLASLSSEAWQQMLQVNLSSVVRLTQRFLSGMQKRQWGRVLMISSILSHIAKEKRAAYSMTKAAVNALARSVALEYGPYGILANSLSPGYVKTDLTHQNNTPKDLEKICAKIPLRRLAHPPEIAQVAYFLCSEQNTYLTAQDIVVDGGFLGQ